MRKGEEGVRSPITGMQYIVLQNTDTEPKTLYKILGSRSGHRRSNLWLQKLISAGYLLETKHRAYHFYSRTPDGDIVAEQLAQIADKMGWVPT